jgi:ABC-type dipeptide/oligopeptide/nickel transport system permease subunit
MVATRRDGRTNVRFIGFLIVGWMGVWVVSWMVGAHEIPMDLTQRMLLPSWDHWLGVDQLGRDIAVRLVAGAHYTIGGAVGIVFVAMLVGVPLGMWVALHVGRWPDWLGGQVSQSVMTLPSIVLALVGASMIDYQGFGLFIPLILFHAMCTMRLVRMCVMKVSQQGHVLYARLTGQSSATVMWLHVWPFVQREVFVMACADVGTVMLAMASLAFLGIGWDTGGRDWGTMIVEAHRVITVHPWELFVPAVAIMLVCYSFFWCSDVLRKK